jgi:hypothetical protein
VSGARRRERHRLAGEAYLSRAWGKHARQDVHERGFAGAVGADNRPDLAGVGLEVNLIEGNDAGEAF